MYLRQAKSAMEQPRNRLILSGCGQIPVEELYNSAIFRGSLYNWRRMSPYPRPEDWVFASPHSDGRLPYRPGAFFRAHILPAAKILGIEGIGWHTFRRTYATLLKANGDDVKTVQELLRHANSLVTMNLYAHAITQNKRGCPKPHCNHAARSETACLKCKPKPSTSLIGL